MKYRPKQRNKNSLILYMYRICFDGNLNNMYSMRRKFNVVVIAVEAQRVERRVALAHGGNIRMKMCVCVCVRVCMCLLQ